MNPYRKMVEQLVEDHFMESEKIEFAEKLLAEKRPAPKSMTKEQERINHYLKYLEKL